MKFSLPSYAKINWKLRVLGKRGDGFHELCTVFQTVSLHDTIHFESADEILLSCDDAIIPTDERNLIVKAAKLLGERFDVKHGAKIHLEKRIPSPGGLGGGSSNATVALIGFQRLWGLDPTIDLTSFSDEIGSDATFFLHGGTAIGTGRGEQIEPLADKSETNMLIVTPNIDIATIDVFARLNAPTLTNNEPEHNLSVCRTGARSFIDGGSELINDLESTVFTMHPEVERVKQTLLKLGAVSAAMSGSGGSVFAVFDNRETRQTALDALDIERDWRKFAVATVSRDEYREALKG